MFNDKIKFSGTLNLKLTDSDNKEKFNYTYNNLVVSTGINYIISRMVSNTSTLMSSIGVGLGSSIPKSNNSTLQSEIYRVPLQGSLASANTATFAANFPPGAGTGPLREAAIFNSTSANSGTMLCRTVFPELNKEGGDTLVITWKVSGE